MRRKRKSERADRLTFQLVERFGAQIENANCECDVTVAITEIQDRATGTSTKFRKAKAKLIFRIKSLDCRWARTAAHICQVRSMAAPAAARGAARGIPARGAGARGAGARARWWWAKGWGKELERSRDG